jgi:hypothetical protein
MVLKNIIAVDSGQHKLCITTCLIKDWYINYTYPYFFDVGKMECEESELIHKVNAVLNHALTLIVNNIKIDLVILEKQDPINRKMCYMSICIGMWFAAKGLPVYFMDARDKYQCPFVYDFLLKNGIAWESLFGGKTDLERREKYAKRKWVASQMFDFYGMSFTEKIRATWKQDSGDTLLMIFTYLHQNQLKIRGVDMDPPKRHDDKHKNGFYGIGNTSEVVYQKPKKVYKNKNVIKDKVPSKVKK